MPWPPRKSSKKFKQVLDDYQVTNYRVVATSAVSEARNREFFRDYIQRETGFKIDIIEGQESCKMIFLAVLKELEKIERIAGREYAAGGFRHRECAGDVHSKWRAHLESDP